MTSKASGIAASSTTSAAVELRTIFDRALTAPAPEQSGKFAGLTPEQLTSEQQKNREWVVLDAVLLAATSDASVKDAAAAVADFLTGFDGRLAAIAGGAR